MNSSTASSSNNNSGSVRMKYRFIRLNPYYCMNETLQLIRHEINEWIIKNKQHDHKVIVDDDNNNYNENNDDKKTSTTEEYISSSSTSYSNQNGNQRLTINKYPIEVSWLKDSQLYFYAIPYNYPIAQLSKCYHIGRYYGQDVSSGAAIAVLLTSIYDTNNKKTSIDYDKDHNHCYSSNDVAVNYSSSNSNHNDDDQVTNHKNRKFDTKIENNHHDHDHNNKYWRVLDLCCAPGLKLCCIADFLRYNNTNHMIKIGQQKSVSGTVQQEQQKYEQLDLDIDRKDIVLINNIKNYSINNYENQHVVIGVDVSNDRLSICKKIIRKYQINNNNCSKSDDITNKLIMIQSDDDNNQNDDNNQIDDNNNEKSNNNNVNIRLYCNDGTTFGQQQNEDTVIVEPLNLLFDLHTTAQQNEIQQMKNHNNKRKRMNKSARSRERQLLKRLSNIDQKQQQCSQLDNNNNVNDNDNDDNTKTSMKLFDRVLVDAECSTDASMKHSSKRLLLSSNKNNKNIPASHEKEEINRNDDYSTSDHSNSEMKIITLQQPVQKQRCDNDDHDNANDNDNYIQNLITLQKKLIQSGFLLLKSNGIMVYSTCSLSYQQNEYIVDWLLKLYPNTATLIPVTFHNTNNEISVQQNSYIQEGSIKGTVRFLPNVIYNNAQNSVLVSSSDCTSSATTINNQETDLHDLYGDGFFLAKIRKK